MVVNLTITVAGPEDQAQAMKDKIREEAFKQGMSVSAWVVHALRGVLEEAKIQRLPLQLK